MNCDNFTKTKPVGKCGTKIWLGTRQNLTGDELLFVRYILNGDEVEVSTDPIIQGNDIFLDLTDPYIDFYSQYNTYYIWLSDSNGYNSDGLTIRNNKADHDGFIVNFANVAIGTDRLIIES
jgi:hypothetical protein